MNRRQGLLAVLLLVSGGVALFTFVTRPADESLRSRLVGAFGTGLLCAVLVLLVARWWFRRRG